MAESAPAWTQPGQQLALSCSAKDDQFIARFEDGFATFIQEPDQWAALLTKTTSWRQKSSLVEQRRLCFISTHVRL